MPLQATSGAASYDAFGGGVPSEPNYIEQIFQTYLYTGNGSTQTITNGIDLSGKGGMVWFKGRSAITLPLVQDTVRGATSVLFTDRVNAASTATDRITSFNSDGVSIGSSSNLNSNGTTYVAWTFRKQPKFFDVVTWTADSSGTGQAVPHNLGSIPGCIIVKALTSSSWFVWNIASGITAARTSFQLNTTDASASSVNSTGQMTSTEFFSGQIYDTDLSRPVTDGTTYLAYIFAHNAGGFGLTGTDNVISCGSYTGNGSSSGPTVTLGYEPQWVMIKNASNTGDWVMFDNMRGLTVGDGDAFLYANTSAAESTGATRVGPSATGFYLKTVASNLNTSGDTYIYIAIRRGPMKVPTTGTSVYNAISYTKTNTTPRDITGAGFSPDLAHYKGRSGGANSGIDNNVFYDRLRGARSLATNSTNAEAAGNQEGTMLQNGIVTSAAGEMNYETGTAILHFFKRAPSFFDEVCYTGNSTAGRTVNHNLGVAPELLIVKRRSLGGGQGWVVYAAPLGNTQVLTLQLTDAAFTFGYWNNTTPTSSVFSLNSDADVNSSSYTYVAYLFATCAGVSKCTAFTGTGTLQTINCGFTSGARFVLIKRTDSTGDWYVWDSSRGLSSSTDPYLLLNSTAAEVTSTNWVDTTSTGFQVTAASGNNVNINGASYIALAIA